MLLEPHSTLLPEILLIFLYQLITFAYLDVFVIISYTKHSYKFVQQINSILANYTQSYIKIGKYAQKYGKLIFIDSSNGYRVNLPYTLICRGPCTQLQTIGLCALSCRAFPYSTTQRHTLHFYLIT